MTIPTYSRERQFLSDYQLIAGVDEVGRGPLAGPVVAAAVILDPENVGHNRSKSKWWNGVRDSKTVSAEQRSDLVEFIRENALDFGIGFATHEEIDELNIHHASHLAMRRALEQMKTVPELVLIDGKFIIPGLQCAQDAVVDGDAKILSIACASIIAKSFRDDWMMKLAEKYPWYGFEQHKGYLTDFHRKRLLEHGPSPVHRMSFSPIKDIMNQRFLIMLG